MTLLNKGDKGPQLVNLSEDPQLSETLSYCFKDGPTTRGQSSSDLFLKGLHCEDIHCTIMNNKGNLMLHPRTDTETYINGKLMMSPTQLDHAGRVVLASIYYLRVNNLSLSMDPDTKKSENMDSYSSQQELLKEQERRLREESDKALEASKAEVKREMCHQRDLLLQDIYEASNEVGNRQQLASELEGKQFKSEEKWLLEEQLQRKMVSNSLDISSYHRDILHRTFFK